MQETWVRSLGWEDPLGMEIPTHPSILPWEYHGKINLVGYSPWWYRGVRHSLVTKQCHHQVVLKFSQVLGNEEWQVYPGPKG